MACAASTAPPEAIAPESASGPSNHWRISWISANGLLVPAWPPAPAATAIRPSAPFSIALCANRLLMMSCSTMPPQPCTAWFTSSRAPRLVMTIGTRYLAQTCMSCSSRSLLLCTIGGGRGFGDPGQPLIELRGRAGIERGHGADDAGLALLDHEPWVADDEQRRADEGERQVLQHGRQGGHGKGSHRTGTSVNSIWRLSCLRHQLSFSWCV